jgi:hypothetical protein
MAMAAVWMLFCASGTAIAQVRVWRYLNLMALRNGN